MAGFLVSVLLRNDSFDRSSLSPISKMLPHGQYANKSSSQETWGGNGTIAGTITITSGTIGRKVRLYEAATGILVREIWSDAAGVYAFNDLRTDIPYTVTETDRNEFINDSVLARVIAV